MRLTKNGSNNTARDDVAAALVLVEGAYARAYGETAPALALSWDGGIVREGETMVDLYTKTILTIIAASLCALVFQNTVQPAGAVGAGCGSLFDPCYVTGTVQVDEPVLVHGSVHTY